MMKKIAKIAQDLGAKFDLYGENIAKLKLCPGNKNGQLVLVSAMTSNASGIGKTTISIGLADALNMIGKDVLLALREPSMGPVFGIKGGATGGGKSSLFPSDEINLHFTGDFHAISQANNLLVSILDNHIFHGNTLNIDTKKIFVKRCLDINDRSLRQVSYKIGDEEITTGFNITAASEVMAICTLSNDLADLKKNLGDILVALDKSGNPIFARDLKAEEAMAILLKDAIRPNLVQTLSGTPALVHLGPFANIAHGASSITSINFALSHAEYVITEAGFGSDLGGEKFLDIVTRKLDKTPAVVVLVVTLAVVKQHGNGDLESGFENVKKHIQNLREVFKVNTIVAINRHSNDDESEISKLFELCGEGTVICDPYDKGGEGCLELAQKVLGQKNVGYLQRTFEMSDDIKTKIEKIATKVYGAGKVSYSELAEEKIALAKRLGFDNFFVNIAKTQFSFSQNKNLLGAPKGFEFNITDIEIRAGAKMIVAIAGNMLLMPGLGKHSTFENMKIYENGIIEGLF